MADVTILQLTHGLPSSTASIPFSQDGNTLRVAPSGLLVNAGKVGINTGTTPLTAELTLARPVQTQGRESIELNVSSEITGGYFDGLKFTQTVGTYNTLASIRCNVFNSGQTALVFSTRDNTGTTLNASPLLTLDRNNGNVLNHGLILSGGSFFTGTEVDSNYNFRNTVGVQSFNIARYFSTGITPIQSRYVHLILPYTNELGGVRSNNMFFLELKGYSLRASGNVINIIFSGYQSHPGNGGLQLVACLDPAGVWQPAVYYSTNYNRTVCRLYMDNDYYTSFVVNAVQVGNGKWALKPGDIQIVTSTSSTI